MFKQFFTIFICALCMLSCTYFENKVQKIPIQQIDTLVDFKSVDAFPLFPNCKEIPSRKKQQICFQLEISQYIYAALKAHSLKTVQQINDTALITLRVSAKGKISVLAIHLSEKTKTKIPEFDSVLKSSVKTLPTIVPAIKRGMPVTTQFVLPIVLKND